jgi:RNA polymerase sigma-32 factor
MSHEEELATTTEYARTRDPVLARKIASANLRLVIKMAIGYAQRSTVPLADLIQEGAVGLMEAIQRYEPQRGVRFATYAIWWIRAFLLRYLLDNSRVVRAGRSRADRHGFFHGEAPGAELSLDAPSAGGDGDALIDLLAAPGELPDRLVEEAEAAALVHSRVAAFEQRLEPRQAAVFRQRLVADEVVPLRQLATQFRVSRERIRQIENELVANFRDFAQAA